MKVYEINGGVFGSTGKIMFGIANEARKHGIIVRCAAPITSTNLHTQPSEKYQKLGNSVSRKISVLLSRITGYNGCFAYFTTRRLIHELHKYNPEIIHLHNLHDSYINLPMLFSYLKKENKKVVWTLHDCWAFTGQCPYFTLENCEKWKTGCFKCNIYRQYPQSLYDNTSTMWHLKKRWFTGIQNMTIVTPSQWLADLARQSFLNEYPINVINNGIDLSVFKPTISKFRQNHEIADEQYVLLGVAFGWGYRKGLDVFIQLSERLDPNQYRIVLVGTDDQIDKQLPNRIISIHSTQNQKELVEIYSAADLFVNPTREENYPTVNMEAIACGTPVITFNTGGSPEILGDVCGKVVPCDDIDALKNEIERICKTRCYSKEKCKDFAQSFSSVDRFDEYVKLYESIC